MMHFQEYMITEKDGKISGKEEKKNGTINKDVMEENVIAYWAPDSVFKKTHSKIERRRELCEQAHLKMYQAGVDAMHCTIR